MQDSFGNFFPTSLFERDTNARTAIKTSVFFLSCEKILCLSICFTLRELFKAVLFMRNFARAKNVWNFAWQQLVHLRATNPNTAQSLFESPPHFLIMHCGCASRGKMVNIAQ